MAKRDNWKRTLMFNCKVNLQCDNEKLQCRYNRLTHSWIVNGIDTGKGVIDFIEDLKSKYKNITVLWKRMY